MVKVCDIIGETRLFKGLDHDVFSQYCGKTSIRVAWKGEIIENEGDECRHIGILLQGKLALQKYTSSGEFATLSLMEEGEMYGEDLLFGTNNLFPVSIEAVSNSKILYIPKSVMIPMLRKNYFLNQNFIRLLSDKVSAQNERIALLSQKTLRQKIAFYLLELYNKGGKKSPPGRSRTSAASLELELPVSKEIIAKLLAMPRPSFSRELINMEKDGLIRVDGRTIRIVDLQKLEQGAIEGYSDEDRAM
jgi:CRP/FNR family transcriptional regulator, dissimilatory nitrate respiration regulator